MQICKMKLKSAI